MSDPGLQPERTSLAWSRTLLSLAVIALFVLRWLDWFGAWTLLPLAGVAAAGLVGNLGHRHRWQSLSSAIEDERAEPAVIHVLSLVGAIWFVGALGLVVVW